MMTTGRIQYDIFLTHNHRQKSWVRRVVAFLRDRGLKVFFDEDSVRPGEDIIRAIERAIDSSKILVLVLSRSSVFSKWVAFETSIRMFDDIESSLHRLIPILIEPVDRTLIPSSVRRLDAVDLTDPITREMEFLHFLRSVGISDVRPAQLPPWPEPSGVEELYIGDLSKVTQWGWTGIQLLDKLISIDYEMFEDITPEQEGHSSQWAPVFLDHPDTWRLLLTPNNEIVGYWHFVPLFEEDFKRALDGTLRDSEITTDRVRVFELPGSYHIYFVSFGLMPRLRKTKGYKLLMNSVFDILLELAKEGIFINQICAVSFTPSGESLCKTLQMTFLKSHADRGKVFLTTLKDILQLEILKEYKELKDLYQNHLGFSGHNEQV